jgi:hypothetical protein
MKIKIGKFKKKSVYDADIEMDTNTQNSLASIGREVITEEQYINIGFNHALIRGLGIAVEQDKCNKLDDKKKVKNRKKSR